MVYILYWFRQSLIAPSSVPSLQFYQERLLDFFLFLHRFITYLVGWCIGEHGSRSLRERLGVVHMLLLLLLLLVLLRLWLRLLGGILLLGVNGGHLSMLLHR